MMKQYPFLIFALLMFISLITVSGCDNSLPNGFPGSEDESHAHPSGWDDPQQHGFAFFDDKSFCEKCHGQDLSGGATNVSCDTCHPASWKEDCTFCHGKKDNQTGAPPLGVHNDDIGFPHSVHVIENTYHIAFCDSCHILPATVDDPKHIDGMYGGEVRCEIIFKDFDNTQYDTTHRTCSNIYCHGNGREPLDGPLSWWTKDYKGLTCSSCHGGYTTSEKLSGKHETHLTVLNLKCSTCHGNMIASDDIIKNKALHINGQVNIQIKQGSYNRDNGTCSVTCHMIEPSWE
ncbi:MAG: CxxxxCH/CxxCH domain-containing protein [Candidatus Magnetomorum sp.]|nr:CxxxxCH/CxxCH domain-containing protein [Candidatus Magnetomorum sp.]